LNSSPQKSNYNFDAYLEPTEDLKEDVKEEI
jgi:hypothetical protein